MPGDKNRGPVLWILLAAFTMRVAGQAIVVLWSPAWLPPMEEWYSGLLSYPLLLSTQIILIVIMACMAYVVTKNGG